MTPPHVAVCEFEPVVGELSVNEGKIADLAKACPPETEVAVFPELCLTGYDLEVARESAIEIPGAATKRLATIAAESGVDLVVGAPECVEESRYNSLFYVSSDGVEATYRKRRPWGDESDVFASGTEATTVETPLGRAGFLLCYDLNFPELAADYSAADCDLVFVSAAWRRSFSADWRLLARARALDNTCYVAASNHCGDQSGREHAGGSIIAGPDGTVVGATPDGYRLASASVAKAALDAGRERNPVREARNGRDSI